MQHVADERYLFEADECQLRATCEHCVYFEPVSGACSEQYPNDAHRLKPTSPGETVIFCKKFELW